MNYHLLTDEKFIDGFIDAAEKVAPGSNVYIYTFENDARFVKSTIGIKLPIGSTALTEYLKKLNQGDRLFVHWFSDELNSHLKSVPSDVVIGLMFWGGDFLEQHPDILRQIYETKTEKIVAQLQRRSSFYKTTNPIVLFRQLKNFLTTKSRWNKYRKNAIRQRVEFLNRLDMFCHWNIEDMYLVQKLYGGNPRFRTFFYDFGFSKFEDKVVEDAGRSEKIIWLGNSATFTNNHADALYHLKKFSNEQIRMMVPLSYGNVRYGKIISAIGFKYFGKKFEGMMNFIPLDEYLAIIKNTDVVVMYHNRTQAGANVFSFLRMGKKVYLKAESTIYALAKQNGIKVFDANTLSSITYDEFIYPLSHEDKEQNRKIVNQLFSESVRFNYLKDILN